MCLNLNDYQFKASRYSYRSTNMKPVVTTNQKLIQWKTWKQPKCPLTDEWIKKMWYIYTVEYYSAIKKNEIM